ncbi:hypothetical protein ZWY2020_044892 [Hordeum vulgare]|nr:hypothetical protein ZWY2020_044892 [Hordeum vulgare]
MPINPIVDKLHLVEQENVGLKERLKKTKERLEKTEREKMTLEKGYRRMHNRLGETESIHIGKNGPWSEKITQVVSDLEKAIEANRKLTVENEKLQYRVSHLIRTIKEAESR